MKWTVFKKKSGQNSLKIILEEELLAELTKLDLGGFFDIFSFAF